MCPKVLVHVGRNSSGARNPSYVKQHVILCNGPWRLLWCMTPRRPLGSYTTSKNLTRKLRQPADIMCHKKTVYLVGKSLCFPGHQDRTRRGRKTCQVERRHGNSDGGVQNMKKKANKRSAVGCTSSLLPRKIAINHVRA